jgi:hypothetical protein
MNIIRNPETSAACQVLYAAADKATKQGRVSLFSAIRFLTGQPLTIIIRNWASTRN